MIRVSVVIPTSNNIPYLSNALISLLPSLQPVDEVIIVVNGDDMVTEGYVAGVAKEAHMAGQAIVRVLRSNPGYTPAMNTGIAAAQGQYIVFGNDDVIFAPDWLEKMFEALVVAQKSWPEVQWAMVGPSTNCGLPSQTLDPARFPTAGDPTKLLATRAEIRKQATRSAYPAAALSGFCLLVHRNVVDTVGNLDESFPGGGFTDNDFQLRAHEAGFGGIVAPLSLVFHHGSVSMTRLTPGHRGGTENLDRYVAKHYHPRHKSIVVNYRVKIDTMADLEMFLESLRRCRELGMEGAVVVDDRSVIDLAHAFKKSGMDTFVRAYTKNSNDMEFDEVRDRNLALSLARAQNTDWIINLDHDEVIDEQVTPALLQRLLNPIDPGIYAYEFPLVTFWRGMTHVRTDGPWGKLSLRTLFRNIPIAKEIYPVAKKAVFHCSRFPSALPSDCVQMTTLLMTRHLGYANLDRAAKKQQWYQATDTAKHVDFIGTPNYEHLTDESSIGLLPYANRSLSVVMMTRNERVDMLRQLRTWLGSVAEVVVVDTGCTDGSIEIAAEWGAKIVPWRCCGQATNPEHMLCDFAAARNAGIEAATSDYIFMIDPDEELVVKDANYLPLLLMQGCDVYNISVHNFHPSKLGAYTQVQGRLFRRHPLLRYSEPIHETIEQAMENFPNLQVANSQLVLYHYGFIRTVGEARKHKNFQYAEKLLDILAERPNDPRALYALGIHLNEARQYDDGDQMLGRAVAIAPEWFLPRWDLACRFIQRGCELLLNAAPDRFPSDDFKNQAVLLLQANLRWCRGVRFNKGTWGEKIPDLIQGCELIMEE